MANQFFSPTNYSLKATISHCKLSLLVLMSEISLLNNNHGRLKGIKGIWVWETKTKI
jgi:hypothetical protein